MNTRSPFIMARFAVFRAFATLVSMALLFSLQADAATVTRKPTSLKTPKYIFLFIGDGMGPAQRALGESMLGNGNRLTMHTFPVVGITATFASDRLITDSGAAATAIATGSKTSTGTISMAPNHRDTLRTIAEMARDKGMKTGILSSVGIDNATPACFYAHSAGRGSYYEIASQMATSRIDFFGGGFAEGDFSSNRKKAKVFSGGIEELMKRAGSIVATSPEALKRVKPGTRCWTYGIYDSKAAMPFSMDRRPAETDLAGFTKEAIRLLDNPSGFFMMVEGGRIDWACHANDAAAAARDVVALDEAVQEALAFYRRHPSDTLIIVTADHETGGLSLGNIMNGYTFRPELLKRQAVSGERFAMHVDQWKKTGTIGFQMTTDSLKTYYGLGDPADPSLSISSDERKTLRKAFDEEDPDSFAAAATRLLNQKAGIGWTTNAHTMLPVQVFAIGAGAEAFGGVYDNTGIARRIMRLAALK